MNKNIVNALRKRINRENNTKRNFQVLRLRNGVELVYAKNNDTGGTFVVGKHISPRIFYIEHGETNKTSQGKGIGKQMRALLTLAAKNAGYKKVRQTSAFLNRSQKNEKKKNSNNYRYNAPPSSYIMKSLGFNQVKIHRNNKGRINQINHEYNFTKNPNNSLLVKSAYPLRTHPLRNKTLRKK